MAFASGSGTKQVRKLADMLKACSIGQSVSHRALSSSIGVSSQSNRYYSLVRRAIGLANAECGALFENARGVGYLRLPGEQINSSLDSGIRKGRRLHKRLIKMSTNTLTMVNDISNAERLKAYGRQATLGLMVHMSYERNMPVVSEGIKPPPTHEVIRATMEALRAARKDV